MTKEEKKELQELTKELKELLLKRAGVTEKDIYAHAMKSWITKNLDLLTPAEMKKYKGKIIF